MLWRTTRDPAATFQIFTRPNTSITISHSKSLLGSPSEKKYGIIWKVSNTTLRILSVRGYPPPFTDFFSDKKRVADLGGPPPPPFTDFSPKIFLKKGLKMVFFAQKTPNFGPKNRLRIWGVPPSPLYGFFFQRKGTFGFGGYPPPPLWTKSAK